MGAWDGNGFWGVGGWRLGLLLLHDFGVLSKSSCCVILGNTSPDTNEQSNVVHYFLLGSSPIRGLITHVLCVLMHLFSPSLFSGKGGCC